MSGKLEQPAGRTRLYRAALALSLVLASFTLAFAQPNDDLTVLQQDPGQWLMPNRTYSAWNYSPLDQVTKYNVKNLQVAWTFQIGVTDQIEAAPLVVGTTMYILTPKPNTLYALDLNQQGYIKWSFAPEMPGLAQAKACCGANSRGFMYADGKIIFNTLDGQLFALDANTGAVIWTTQVADLSLTETTTMSPLVAGHNVIVGVEGGERGIRGHVSAYDLDTGAQVWKFYNMGPDEEMGIGPDFKPFYPTPDSPGTSTWYGDSWKTGGGAVWGWFTFDPESNLFYYGTGNCAPWNPDYRRDPATAPGLDQYTNAYCASEMARDATTGNLVWAYQATPQDAWDYDLPAGQQLVDLTIDGQTRRALMKPARNGFFYVWDAHTGELLHQPIKYTTVTWADHVDMETGMPVYNDDAIVYTGTETGVVCPFGIGNWHNTTYSPKTGLIYFQAYNTCSTMTGTEGEYTPGESYVLETFGARSTGPGGWTAQIQAWDPATGEQAWNIKSNQSLSWPIMSTAGDLVFGGDNQGAFRALDAETGELLWSFRTGSGFDASPISFRGTDGRQYIAVIGSKAPANSVVTADTAPDNTGRYTRPGSTLYVFGLPR